MEVQNSGFLEYIAQLLLMIFVIVGAVIGLRKVYIGNKKKQKWARITKIVLIIVFVLLVIAGFAFYLYALALSEAFSTGH